MSMVRNVGIRDDTPDRVVVYDEIAHLNESYIEHWRVDGETDDSLAVLRAQNAGRDYLRCYEYADINFESSIDVVRNGTENPLKLDMPTARVTHNAPGGLFVGESFRNGYIRFHKITYGVNAGHVFNQLGISINLKVDIDELKTGASPTAKFWLGRDAEFVGGTGYTTQMYKSDIKVGIVRTATGGGNAQPAAIVFDHKTKIAGFVANDIDFGFAYGSSEDIMIDVSAMSDTGSRNRNNMYLVKAGEVTAAGVIRISGEMSSEIHVGSFDFVSAATVSDMVILNSIKKEEKDTILGVAAGTNTIDGRNCVGMKVDYSRASGDIGAFNDINLGDSDYTRIHTDGATSPSSISIEANYRPFYLFGGNFVTMKNHSGLLNPPKDIRSGILLAVDAAGEISLNAGYEDGLYRKVDTEALAATGTLVKIIGGFPEQILEISQFQVNRKVTVQHGADITLAESLDVVLDSVDSRLVLKCTAPDVWEEVSRNIIPDMSHLLSGDRTVGTGNGEISVTYSDAAELDILGNPGILTSFGTSVPDNLVNGSITGNAANAWGPATNNIDASNQWINFHLNNGGKALSGLRVAADPALGGTWKVQGSFNGANYVDLTSYQLWGPDHEFTFKNGLEYSDYRLVGEDTMTASATPNTIGFPWTREVTFVQGSI